MGRVVAIGGMVLSRGLTLEGLMTSYYSRNAGTYDTLLQMCRWFGYRPKYEDLCRVYVTQDNIDRFDAVLTAVEDMKEQFAEMKRQDKKPSEFGLMIQESPDTLETSLLITARNKMKGTEVLTRSLSYGGVYADTSKLSRDISVNNHNVRMVERFLQNVRFEFNDSRYMASSVSKFIIADLIRSLKIPYVNKKFDTDGLAEYIENSDVFMYWDVVIARGDSKSPEMQSCFGISNLSATVRNFHTKGEQDAYIRIGGTNNRVMDPGIFDAGLDLTAPQKELILKERGKSPNSELVAADYLKLRQNPLLVIYPIDLFTKLSSAQEDMCLTSEQRDKLIRRKEAIKDEVGNRTTPLVAFAFGFPKKESAVKLTYRANRIKLDELTKGLEIDDEGEGAEEADD